MILSFFKDGSGGSIVPAKPGTENVAESSGESVKAAPVAVSVQGRSYYVLQYGLFSTKEGAEQAKRELEQYGLAAGNDPDEEYRVYAEASRPTANRPSCSAASLKTREWTCTLRKSRCRAVSELKFAGDANTAGRYFETSSELASKLSTLSAALLSQEKPGALNASEQAAVTDIHSRWTEAMKSFQTGLSREDEQLGAQIEQTMNSAVSALTEYNRNASKALLWEIQSRMMQYVMQQKELISKLGKA